MKPIDVTADSESRSLTVRDFGTPLLSNRALPAVEASIASAQDYVSLATYWHTLLKRRWTVVTVAIIVTTIVAIVSFKMQPIFKATARVQVESQTPLIQSIEELFQKDNADDTFVQTQIQILKSENLAWRTIEELQLAGILIKPKNMAKIPPEKRQVRLIGAFNKKLTVELTPKTRMLAVSFEDPDPQLAARVSTSLVNNYIDYSFREKYDATRQASAWMEQQLDELKAKVESSQQALVAYEREHQIVNTGDNKGSMQEQMLSDMGRDLTAAKSDRLQKESLYQEVAANPDQLATLVHDDLLQKLEERSADLQDQYNETVSQYGPQFPKAIRLKGEIDGIGSQMGGEQTRVLARIRKDYAATVTREKLAAGAVAAQKEVVGAQNQLLIQHNILQHEFEGNQQLYQSLMQRLKNATVSAGLQSTNIHLVDAALPRRAGSPPKGAQHSLGLSRRRGLRCYVLVRPGGSGSLDKNGRRCGVVADDASPCSGAVAARHRWGKKGYRGNKVGIAKTWRKVASGSNPERRSLYQQKSTIRAGRSISGASYVRIAVFGGKPT